MNYDRYLCPEGRRYCNCSSEDKSGSHEAPIVSFKFSPPDDDVNIIVPIHPPLQDKSNENPKVKLTGLKRNFFNLKPESKPTPTPIPTTPVKPKTEPKKISSGHDKLAAKVKRDPNPVSADMGNQDSKSFPVTTKSARSVSKDGYNRGRSDQPTTAVEEEVVKYTPPEIIKPDPIRCSLCLTDIQPMDEVYFKLLCLEDCHLLVHKGCLQESLASQGLRKKREYKEGMCPTEGCSAHINVIYEFSMTNEESLYLKCTEKKKPVDCLPKKEKKKEKKVTSKNKDKSTEPENVPSTSKEGGENDVQPPAHVLEEPAVPSAPPPVKKTAARIVLPPPKPNRSVPLPVDIDNVVLLEKEKSALENKYAVSEPQHIKKTKAQRKKKGVLDIEVGLRWDQDQGFRDGFQDVQEEPQPAGSKSSSIANDWEHLYNENGTGNELVFNNTSSNTNQFFPSTSTRPTAFRTEDCTQRAFGCPPSHVNSGAFGDARFSGTGAGFMDVFRSQNHASTPCEFSDFPLPGSNEEEVEMDNIVSSISSCLRDLVMNTPPFKPGAKLPVSELKDALFLVAGEQLSSRQTAFIERMFAAVSTYPNSVRQFVAKLKYFSASRMDKNIIYCKNRAGRELENSQTPVSISGPTVSGVVEMVAASSQKERKSTECSSGEGQDTFQDIVGEVMNHSITAKRREKDAQEKQRSRQAAEEERQRELHLNLRFTQMEIKANLAREKEDQLAAANSSHDLLENTESTKNETTAAQDTEVDSSMPYYHQQSQHMAPPMMNMGFPPNPNQRQFDRTRGQPVAPPPRPLMNLELKNNNIRLTPPPSVPQPKMVSEERYNAAIELYSRKEQALEERNLELQSKLERMQAELDMEKSGRKLDIEGRQRRFIAETTELTESRNEARGEAEKYRSACMKNEADSALTVCKSSRAHISLIVERLFAQDDASLSPLITSFLDTDAEWMIVEHVLMERKRLIECGEMNSLPAVPPVPVLPQLATDFFQSAVTYAAYSYERKIPQYLPHIKKCVATYALKCRKSVPDDNVLTGMLVTELQAQSGDFDVELAGVRIASTLGLLSSSVTSGLSTSSKSSSEKAGWEIGGGPQSRQVDLSAHECKICLDVVGENNVKKVLSCPECVEPYHSKCVRAWLNTNSTCPQCRRNWPDPVNFPGLGAQ